MHLHDLRLFGALLERPLGLVVFVHYLTTFSEGSCGVYRGFSVKNNCDWGHKRKGNVEGVVHPQAGVGQSVWNGGWTLNRSVRVPSRGAAARGVPAPGSATRFRPRPVGGCPASQVVGRPEIRVRPNARMGMGGHVLLTVRRPDCRTGCENTSGQALLPRWCCPQNPPGEDSREGASYGHVSTDRIEFSLWSLSPHRIGSDRVRGR